MTSRCQNCRGRGRCFTIVPFSFYACTECNGTGIKGDPRGALLVLVACILAELALVALWVKWN